VVHAVTEKRQERRDIDFVLAEVEGVDADNGAPEARDDACVDVSTARKVGGLGCEGVMAYRQ